MEKKFLNRLSTRLALRINNKYTSFNQSIFDIEVKDAY